MIWQISDVEKYWEMKQMGLLGLYAKWLHINKF